MSMVVPHFSPESQKSAARHEESLLDKVLQDKGQTIPSPKERLQDVLNLFEEKNDALLGKQAP
jgi:hypothetical protein